MEGLDVPAISVNEKELEALEKLSVAVMDQAQRVASSIQDETSLKDAQAWCAERLTFAGNLRKKSWLSSIRDTWHKQHKSVCDIIERYASPHEVAVKKVVNPAITIWMTEQERIRQEKEKRLQEEAKRRDEEARIARAEQLAKDGKPDQADLVLERPGQFVAPKLDPVKVQGMSMRSVWKVKEPVDASMLVKAIADGRVPINAIAVNYSFLNKQAQLMDGNLHYPGVEVYQEQILSHRRTA